MELAKLPARDEMLSMLLAGIQSPVSGFVSVLNGTLRKLLYALNAVIEKGNASSSGGEAPE